MRAPELKGIVAATVLPMTESLEIDLDAFRGYLGRLLDEGVHGLGERLVSRDEVALEHPADDCLVARGALGDHEYSAEARKPNQ